MSRAPLLVEIGCEEIPARMIPAAAAELSRRLVRILDEAGLAHGASAPWGGSRRLAVRVEDVDPRQVDRDEVVLGPPAAVAFTGGRPGPAALGFAKKQGIDPERLEAIETERGSYVGLRRNVPGRPLGALLADGLPPAVESMPFPKTMRWAEGRFRWVRPVHWLVALHGDAVLPVELFGVRAGRASRGHRFLGPGEVVLEHADSYRAKLAEAAVVVDPLERRRRLVEALAAAAAGAEGRLVEDGPLLEEVVDLVEWPGVVAGRFDPVFLELPRELLVTTLRHHQKCFSVQDGAGQLLPVFLAVANTDRDPAGHVRRGNEWVVVGRLEDARFFWREDRRALLAARLDKLAGVVFHARLGSYADKEDRVARLAARLAERLALDPETREHCRAAASLCKHDLVSGTVGEFPELQGRVGGLLLREEGQPEAVAAAVYAHWQPAGADDDTPATLEGAIVALADKLDTVASLLGAGETATSSRDPFGLRRAAGGVFRIALERRWNLSLAQLVELSGSGSGPEPVAPGQPEEPARQLSLFLRERFVNHLRDAGASANEVSAVLRPSVAPEEWLDWPLHDVAARIEAIAGVRQRTDFARLVELTKRVDTILARNAELASAVERADTPDESVPAARALTAEVERLSPELEELSRAQRYAQAVEALARLIEPVERFFQDVLVIDRDDPGATVRRYRLLQRLGDLLTRCFDIRELAGQAQRRD